MPEPTDRDAPTLTPAAPTATSSRTRYLTTAALVAALMAASAWISIPLGAVPVTLQVFVVVLAALLLPDVWAAVAIGVYVLLGAIGVPVFSGGGAGVGTLAGPTGGYIFGFLIGAPLGAFVRGRLQLAGARQIVADIACAVATIASIYLLGWVQLALVTGIGAGAAFLVGVLPFLAADAIKAAIAIGIARAVRKAGFGT